MANETLIVVASYDDRYKENVDSFKGGDVVVWSTADGGYTTGAFKAAFNKHYYRSYLFVQDSIRANVDDCVAPFRENGKDVVAWGTFPLFFDDPYQEKWVLEQYPGQFHPKKGIFGPIFYATRRAITKLSDKRLLPATPPNKLMEQGTERAWAYACLRAGLNLGSLGDCITDGVSPRLFPSDQTFTKTFAGRT